MDIGTCRDTGVGPLEFIFLCISLTVCLSIYKITASENELHGGMHLFLGTYIVCGLKLHIPNQQLLYVPFTKHRKQEYFMNVLT